jgi:hypothetical protein
MSVANLTEQEQAVVYDCLRAATEGPFFAEREFGALFGMARAEVRSVMRAWPRVDRSDGTVALAISNAIANLLSHAHAMPEERRRWVPASDEEIFAILGKWHEAPVMGPAQLLRTLGDLMSGLSETCYEAPWMVGTEYMVPELCRRAVESGEAQPWGRGAVTPAVARHLSELAEKLGGWARLDKAGTGYLPFAPFPTPDRFSDELDFWKRRSQDRALPGGHRD